MLKKKKKEKEKKKKRKRKKEKEFDFFVIKKKRKKKKRKRKKEKMVIERKTKSAVPPKNEMPVIFVRHAGHEFTLDEMTLAGEKHKRDVSLFFAMGPDALDRISLPDPDRVFAMLWCYYN